MLDLFDSFDSFTLFDLIVSLVVCVLDALIFLLCLSLLILSVLMSLFLCLDMRVGATLRQEKKRSRGETGRDNACVESGETVAGEPNPLSSGAAEVAQVADAYGFGGHCELAFVLS